MKVDKAKVTAAPPMDCIRLAIEMLNAPGAPTFATKREGRQATVMLARELWMSER